MSSTNRGAIRNESDFYRTPLIALEPLKEIIGNKRYSCILEPCAGDGAIVKYLRWLYGVSSSIVACEINEDHRNSLFEAGANIVRIGDFLNFDFSISDLIITNPPYGIAQEIVEHCFKVAMVDAEIIMLLRLGFLGSKKRSEFWKNHPVTQIYPLSKRPSFTGNGNDSADYAWYVWSTRRQPLIRPI
jgi:hypothetical protein